MVTITKYVWDTVSDCVLSELDENNAVTAVYTNEPQQYGGVLSQRRGTTSHYHHHDALGSTRFLTDSSGNVTDTYLYDAWGNNVASTGMTVNPFKWVGKYGYYTDDSTGKVYVRARMYEPTAARWCSMDPLGFSETTNRFKYGRSNSAEIDPSGLKSTFTIVDIPDCLTCSDRLSRLEVEGSIFSDDLIDKAYKCQVNIFCGDCGMGTGGQLHGSTWAGDGYVHICLSAKAFGPGTNTTDLVNILLHEVTHANQLINQDKSRCKRTPFVGDPPTPPRLADITCGDCTKLERPAYHRQCTHTYGESNKEAVDQCIKAGLCLSCGHIRDCGVCKGNPQFPIQE